MRWNYSTHQVLADRGLPTLWRDFIAYHASADFFGDIVTLFGEAITALYPRHFPSVATLRSQRVGVRKRDSFWNADVLMDAQIAGNTPVTEASSVRTTHVDKGDKLFSGLFYMRPDGYDAVGGDLTISRFRSDLVGDPRRFGHFRDAYVDDSLVEHVATVPYSRNCVVLFVNSLDSLHGVTVRQPTEKSRLFVNLVGEIDPPLYELERRGRPAHYFTPFPYPAPVARSGVVRSLDRVRRRIAG